MAGDAVEAAFAATPRRAFLPRWQRRFAGIERALDIGHGQELHVFFVEGFEVSPFEAEFGRHVALFHPIDDFPALRRRIVDAGGELVEPLRATPFERLFFREPVNGYLFELIDRERHRQILDEA